MHGPEYGLGRTGLLDPQIKVARHDELGELIRVHVLHILQCLLCHSPVPSRKCLGRRDSLQRPLACQTKCRERTQPWAG